jgi:glyoxylase-like metal-dependent hydrolase (beta-lactamase superfamily II)
VLRPVLPYAAVLLADNPSPMTLEGTNTWLLRAPGEQRSVVVDPGPADEWHQTAVAAAGPVAAILLTHGHHDHSAGARRLHELTGAPVRALDPAHRLGGEGLAAGDVVAAAGIELRVLATPGHSADSLCFVASGPDGGTDGGWDTSATAGPARTAARSPAGSSTGATVGSSSGATAGSAGGSPAGGLGGRAGGLGGDPAGGPAGRAGGLGGGPAVLTGDTVLGRGSTVVAHPDGRLADYLDSLRRLRELGALAVLPGHGPELADLAAAAQAYLAHREERLAQVRAALAELGPDVTARAVVERVYADVEQRLWAAAEQSVRAQLDYLRATR